MVIEIVKANDGALGHLGEKPLDQIGTNKTGRTGNQYASHGIFFHPIAPPSKSQNKKSRN
jgi:hypothetical protein